MEDLKDLKVGDSVWTIQCGECEIIYISLKENYPITVKAKNNQAYIYCLNGNHNKGDHYRSLFRSNPFEKKEEFTPRWMMVSVCGTSWIKRFVFAYKNGVYISWTKAETDDAVKNEVATINWQYAKEIEEPQPIEVTIEQIAEKFGVSAEQIKIKK